MEMIFDLDREGFEQYAEIANGYGSANELRAAQGIPPQFDLVLLEKTYAALGATDDLARIEGLIALSETVSTLTRLVARRMDGKLGGRA